MVEKKITIINKLGLHARAAAKLVAHASRYACDIEISKHKQTVNGKSIMGVMMLAASQGAELNFKISGDDECDALRDIEELIQDKFGEAE